jgi:hypothetical protein
MAVLHRIRKGAVDEARLKVGACLSAEADLAGTIRQLDEEAERAAAVPFTMEGYGQLLGMFEARDRHRRVVRHNLTASLAAAEARTAEARAELALARLGAEAVETLLEARALAAEAATERKAQHALDDIASGMRARGRSKPGNDG